MISNEISFPPFCKSLARLSRMYVNIRTMKITVKSFRERKKMFHMDGNEKCAYL